MQAELLLISRELKAIHHYLPKLQRCANFIETRRDPQNLSIPRRPAANLLAPSYAGWKRPDGTFDKAYLTGLSATYVAVLDGYADSDDTRKQHIYRLGQDTRKYGLAILSCGT